VSLITLVEFPTHPVNGKTFSEKYLGIRANDVDPFHEGQIVGSEIHQCFYKNNFIRIRGSLCPKFKNKLRTIPFSVKVVNKTAASAAQLAKCILLHAYSLQLTVA